MNDSINIHNPFFVSFSYLVDSLILGLLWLVCSLPLITIGASSTAFYYTYHKCIRQKRGYAWKTFFHSFRENFKQATIGWLILLVLAAVMIVDCFILNAIDSASSLPNLFQAILLVMLLVLAMFALYFFAYIARFEDTLVHIFKNSLLILLANFLWSLLLFVVFVIALFLARKFFLLMPIILILMPTAYMFVANKILERVFRKYMKSEDVAIQIAYEQDEFPSGR